MFASSICSLLRQSLSKPKGPHLTKSSNMYESSSRSAVSTFFVPRKVRLFSMYFGYCRLYSMSRRGWREGEAGNPARGQSNITFGGAKLFHVVDALHWKLHMLRRARAAMNARPCPSHTPAKLLDSFRWNAQSVFLQSTRQRVPVRSCPSRRSLD